MLSRAIVSSSNAGFFADLRVAPCGGGNKHDAIVEHNVIVKHDGAYHRRVRGV